MSLWDAGRAVGKIVVHGHTPVSEPEFRPIRINVDAGGYASSNLTAVVRERSAAHHLDLARAATLIAVDRLSRLLGTDVPVARARLWRSHSQISYKATGGVKSDEGMPGYKLSLLAPALAVAGVAIASLAHAAERGPYTYFSADSCASANKMPKEVCFNAARNAAAEFEEKVPHFPTRAACEQAYRPGGCAVSFRQSAPGAKSGVSFTPRQQGFRVIVRSDNDISTTPLAPGLNFSTRTAIRLAIGIDPKAAGAAAPRYGGGGGGETFGSSEPNGPRGGLPPPIPVDPNFDCSKYVEPSAKGDPNTACAPVPNWRR